jgi:hypothetical protein
MQTLFEEEVFLAMAHPGLSGEEIERRGQELYEQRIRAQVEVGNEGKICMIDVETGNYEVGETMLDTGKRLFAKNPNAALWAVRIGYDVVYSFGGGMEPTKR